MGTACGTWVTSREQMGSENSRSVCTCHARAEADARARARVFVCVCVCVCVCVRVFVCLCVAGHEDEFRRAASGARLHAAIRACARVWRSLERVCLVVVGRLRSIVCCLSTPCAGTCSTTTIRCS